MMVLGGPAYMDTDGAIRCGAPGQQHYAASKTALLAVMRAPAVELARHQVRCNSLLPGWTDTEPLAEARHTRNS